MKKNNVFRGVVTVVQLPRIKELALDIVEGLEEANDHGPPVNATKDLDLGRYVDPLEF